MTLHGVGKLTRKLKPDEADVRTIAASLTAFVVLTFALVLPPLTAIPRMHRTSIGVLALTLVPQALPLAIPVALSIGLGWGWPRDPDGDRVWRRGIVLGIAGALMAAATMQWLVRAANQAFRLTVAAELGMGPTFICICERVQQSKGLSPDRRGFQALTAGGPATARSHQRRL